jgi:acetyl-CoA synthase
MQVEFGGKGGICFEWLTMKGMDEVQDGKISLIGPDPLAHDVGSNVPLGMIVEVAGEKLEKDFEPILERQIHHFLNGAEGVQHQGQRDITWIRIGKSAVAKGFNLGHIGHILYTRFHDDFDTLVDKLQVTFYTEVERVKELIEEAHKAYRERNERIAVLTEWCLQLVRLQSSL